MEGFRSLTSTLNSHPGWINAELRRRRVSRRSFWSGPGPAGSELPVSCCFLQDAAAADASLPTSQIERSQSWRRKEKNKHMSGKCSYKRNTQWEVRTEDLVGSGGFIPPSTFYFIFYLVCTSLIKTNPVQWDQEWQPWIRTKSPRSGSRSTQSGMKTWLMHLSGKNTEQVHTKPTKAAMAPSLHTRIK